MRLIGADKLFSHHICTEKGTAGYEAVNLQQIKETPTIDGVEVANGSCRLTDAYEQGREDVLNKVRDWCSDALASNEPTAEQKQGISLCLSWVIAEQLNE